MAIIAVKYNEFPAILRVKAMNHSNNSRFYSYLVAGIKNSDYARDSEGRIKSWETESGARKALQAKGH